MNLKQVLDSDKYVLIDFYSDTCPPCRVQEEILAQLDHPLLKIFQLDRDKHPEIAKAFSVTQVPFLYLFKQKKPIAAEAGIFDLTKLKEWLKERSNGDIQ